MGCISSKDPEASVIAPEALKSVETAFALAVSPSGIEAVNEVGKAPNLLPKSGWHSSKAAVKISAHQVLVLGWNGVHMIDLKDGTITKYHNEDYHLITAVICTSLGSPDAPPTLVTLSGAGMKRVDLSNGGFSLTKIADTFWDTMNVTAVLHHSPSRRTVVLTVTGAWSLNLENGASEKLPNSTNWISAKCGVVYPDGGSAMIFADVGQYKMNMIDGSYEKVGKEIWPRAQDAVLNKDGSACLVFNDNATYRVDLATGAQTKIEGNSWHTLKAVCRLGADAGMGLRIQDGKNS